MPSQQETFDKYDLAVGSDGGVLLNGRPFLPPRIVCEFLYEAARTLVSMDWDGVIQRHPDAGDINYDGIRDCVAAAEPTLGACFGCGRPYAECQCLSCTGWFHCTMCSPVEGDPLDGAKTWPLWLEQKAREADTDLAGLSSSEALDEGLVEFWRSRARTFRDVAKAMRESLYVKTIRRKRTLQKTRDGDEMVDELNTIALSDIDRVETIGNETWVSFRFRETDVLIIRVVDGTALVMSSTRSRTRGDFFGFYAAWGRAARFIKDNNILSGG